MLMLSALRGARGLGLVLNVTIKEGCGDLGRVQKKFLKVIFKIHRESSSCAALIRKRSSVH